MTCVITLSTPVSPEQLRWVLDHAAAMAETIDVDATVHEIRVRMADLRLGEPVRLVEVRDVVATADSGSVASDEVADDVVVGGGVLPDGEPFLVYEGRQPVGDDACPDDPDGQHHVGCGCDDVDDDQVPDEPPAETGVKQAILDHLRTHGPVLDPAGRAASLLAEAIGSDVTSRAYQRHLKQLDQDGQITRDQPNSRQTVRIALPGDDSPPPATNRDLVLAALVEHGPVVDPSGSALRRLGDLVALDLTNSGLAYIVRGLVDDGLVVKRGTATRTTWIGTTAQADEPDDEPDDEPEGEPDDEPEGEPDDEPEGGRRGPMSFGRGSTGWLILEEVAADGGRFTGSQHDLGRIVNRKPNAVHQTVHRLVNRGLLSRGSSSQKVLVLTTAGWAHLGQEPPADEPAPADPEATPEVEDVPESDEPPVDWSFMGRTDRADREAAAAAPKGNVLDAVEGPDDKGRPLIDSVEVVEELSDEELAKILGKAGA